MSDRPQHPSDNRLSRAAALRAAADGELAPHKLGDVSDSEDASIAFEKALRESVGRVMGNKSAPDALRQRIAAALAAAPEPAAADTGALRTPMGDTASRSFWSGTRRRFALAAMLALVVTAAIVASFQFSLFRGSGISAAIHFIDNEHDRCATFGKAFERKFTATTDADSIRTAVEILNSIPSVLEFPIASLQQAGYEFAGLGGCRIPGDGKSVHLIYRSSRQAVEPMSLFIQVDTGATDLAEGRSYIHHLADEADQTICIWRIDGFIYYLFTIGDEARRVAGAAFRAPAAEEPLVL